MEICFTRLIIPSGTLRISGLLLLHNSGGICMTSCKVCVRDRNKFLFILHKVYELPISSYSNVKSQR